MALCFFTRTDLKKYLIDYSVIMSVESTFTAICLFFSMSFPVHKRFQKSFGKLTMTSMKYNKKVQMVLKGPPY